MKHIKELLVKRQLSLFGTYTGEKGRAEWSTFNVVRGDSSGAYSVATPLRQQPRYTNIVPIRRYNVRGIFPKPAHQ